MTNKIEIICVQCNNKFDITKRALKGRKYKNLCRKCIMKNYANQHYAINLIDISSIKIDKENFKGIDTKGVFLPQKMKFEFSCTKCNKSYTTQLEREKNKKYAWHCKSCAISREWNENKSYYDTHQQALKISNSTPEAKLRLSTQSKKNWKNFEVRKKMLTRNHAAAVVKGRETRIKNLLLGKTKLKVSHGKRSLFDNGIKKFYVRSSYELRFAHILDKTNLKWEYEHKSFAVCNNTKSYTPDFWIENYGYVEIKGWWRDDAYEKYTDFVSQKIEKIVLIQKLDLEKLEKNDTTIENLFN